MNEFTPTKAKVLEAMILNPGLDYDFVESALEALNEVYAKTGLGEKLIKHRKRALTKGIKLLSADEINNSLG